jgi:nucleoside-diphosphate kinase
VDANRGGTLIAPRDGHARDTLCTHPTSHRDPGTPGIAQRKSEADRYMAELQRTLLLVKPDGVQRQLVGRVLSRFEDRGLKLVGLKLVQVDRTLAEEHYAVHRDKPFFPGLVEFITSGPLVAAALEGPNAIAIVRAMNGATRPHEAAPGSIRGDLAVETAQNLVHASDSPENAAAELALWFRPEELLGYEREIDRWVLAPGD